MNGCYNTMGIDRVRGSAGVAGCVLAVAAACAPGLAAQGAKEANGRGRPSATVAGPSSHLQPARGILGDLVGTWQFQIWFAGNFSGTPDVSGIRVMKALFDDLRLEWTEVLDHSQVQGQGLVGFDPRATVSSARPYTTWGLRPSCSPGSRTMLSRALRSTPSPLRPVRASCPLRRCLPSPWSTTITSRGRHRTARGAPSSPAASHKLHHEQQQVVGPRLGPRSFVVARPCAPPPRSRAVAWLLLEFPSCTPPPAPSRTTGLRA